jgi:dimethylargininase
LTSGNGSFYQQLRTTLLSRSQNVILFMLQAITHTVSPHISNCELTFVDRLPIDVELAHRQHQEYCSALERLGVRVMVLAENESYPDCCFVEDTAIVVDELAVICSMGAPSRRGETKLIERELSKYRETIRIALPATIDGGDVLTVGERVFVGQSTRTNAEGIEALTRILEPLGYRVVPVSTKGSLHFKSACTAIDDETLFVNPDWIEPDQLNGFNLIHTPPDEPSSANVLRVGKTVCVQAGFPRAAELIARVGHRVEVIDTSELRKAEAGLTCSSIVFEDKRVSSPTVREGPSR